MNANLGENSHPPPNLRCNRGAIVIQCAFGKGIPTAVSAGGWHRTRAETTKSVPYASRGSCGFLLAAQTIAAMHSSISAYSLSLCGLTNMNAGIQLGQQFEKPPAPVFHKVVLFPEGLSEFGSDGHKIWALFKIVVLFHEHRCDGPIVEGQCDLSSNSSSNSRAGSSAAFPGWLPVTSASSPREVPKPKFQPAGSTLELQEGAPDAGGKELPSLCGQSASAWRRPCQPRAGALC
jgi:hypothetical protein